jgi:type II secretory pathway component PulM
MIVERIQDWYASRESREQRILRFGGIAAALLLLIAILAPLQRSTAALEKRIATKQADLAWMRSVASTLIAAGPMPAPNAPQESLVVLVDRTARESGLAQSLTGSQPSGDGGLRVQLEKAQFNSLVAWVARLSEQNGIRVESASVDAAGEPGVVNAGVVLRAR